MEITTPVMIKFVDRNSTPAAITALGIEIQESGLWRLAHITAAQRSVLEKVPEILEIIDVDPDDALFAPA